ncbi:hypothetical protein ALNOE001_12970 [Candidatus Methanobinarius endosymbioticus]|uniref:Uncharacterized protein n=1 Tax=Candidatus Methanobinarius endosymbioticus TaxID=2006182 RepID=A0A366MBQ6_9EURY|nr:hypothetical protein ALNOE001_12970 [Candidatus Methanobinarius endosymbioticus]
MAVGETVFPDPELTDNPISFTASFLAFPRTVIARAFKSASVIDLHLSLNLSSGRKHYRIDIHSF